MCARRREYGGVRHRFSAHSSVSLSTVSCVTCVRGNSCPCFFYYSTPEKRIAVALDNTTRCLRHKLYNVCLWPQFLLIGLLCLQGLRAFQNKTKTKTKNIKSNQPTGTLFIFLITPCPQNLIHIFQFKSIFLFIIYQLWPCYGVVFSSAHLNSRSHICIYKY